MMDTRGYSGHDRFIFSGVTTLLPTYCNHESTTKTMDNDNAAMLASRLFNRILYDVLKAPSEACVSLIGNETNIAVVGNVEFNRDDKPGLPPVRNLDHVIDAGDARRTQRVVSSFSGFYVLSACSASRLLLSSSASLNLLFLLPSYLLALCSSLVSVSRCCYSYVTWCTIFGARLLSLW